MVSILLILAFFIEKASQLQCYECSNYPREPGSEDEPLGPCPGWTRPAKYYGLNSIYDGCMTVKLAGNGSVLAQNAVIFSQCLSFQRNVPASLIIQGLEVKVRCCQESKCNAPRKYRWSQMLHKMDGRGQDPKHAKSIANHRLLLGTPEDSCQCHNPLLLQGEIDMTSIPAATANKASSPMFPSIASTLIVLLLEKC